MYSSYFRLESKMVPPPHVLNVKMSSPLIPCVLPETTDTYSSNNTWTQICAKSPLHTKELNLYQPAWRVFHPAESDNHYTIFDVILDIVL